MLRKLKTCFAVVLIGLFFMVSAAPAVDYQPYTPEYGEDTAAAMAADALVVRPVGIAATVVGGALFIVSLPFSALGGNTDQTFDRMVADPARFTFTRELGKF